MRKTTFCKVHETCNTFVLPVSIISILLKFSFHPNIYWDTLYLLQNVYWDTLYKLRLIFVPKCHHTEKDPIYAYFYILLGLMKKKFT